MGIPEIFSKLSFLSFIECNDISIHCCPRWDNKPRASFGQEVPKTFFFCKYEWQLIRHYHASKCFPNLFLIILQRNYRSRITIRTTLEVKLNLVAN